MQLRKGTVEDLDAILKIERSVFSSDFFNRRQFRYLMTKAKTVFIVICDDRGVAGYSILFTPSHLRHSRVYNIAVSNEARGKGYGKALLQRMEKDSRNLSYSAIRLEVRRDNRPAISLYEQFGYRGIGEKPDYYEDGQDALIYQKQLDE